MIVAISTIELSLWLGACVLFVFLSGLFSGSETGLYCVNRIRLQLAAHQREKSASRLQGLFSDRAGLLFTTLVGTNIANYLAPVCLTVVFLKTADSTGRRETEALAELYTTLILTPVVFIFGEIVPKNLFQRNADILMARVSIVLRATHILIRLTGLTALQKLVSDLVLRRLRRQAPSGSLLHSRLDMYQMIREGAAEGALTLTQSSILDRIHQLKSIQVSSVMVPQSRVVMASADSVRRDIEGTIRRTRFSRMPVFSENRRRVIGVVHLLDILTAEDDQPVRGMAMRPIEILPDVTVIDALSTLQREYRRMAIVVSSSGRCIGIVTVKDLVEEVVGELAAW